MILEDADTSASQLNPVLNTGDKAMLFIDAATCFGAEVQERVDVFGYIYPEHGSPGVISFRTPSSYSDTVFDLL